MTENSKTRNDLDYIPAKVVLHYSLWGGAVAGFWLGLVISPPLILLTVPAGIPIGFLPAFLCGCYLAWRRVYNDNPFYASLAGAISATLCAAPLDWLIHDKLTGDTAILTFLGAVSAFTLAFFILPSPPEGV